MTSTLQSAMCRANAKPSSSSATIYQVPLNWRFFKQFQEVQSYVRAKSPLVFTEQVEITK